MERFFILDNFNTWYNWRLILTGKDITPPEPKSYYVNIDGMSGTLDLSEALTGEITYNDRTLSASFWTDNGTYKERAKLLRDIRNALHGKKIKIIEPDDPTHYFIGRVKIKSEKNIIPYAEFSIEATCEPWRYSIEETERIVPLNEQTVTDVVITNNGVKTVSPIIKASGVVHIEYGGQLLSLSVGTHKISDIKLIPGVNIIGVSGFGTASFIYREADL